DHLATGELLLQPEPLLDGDLIEGVDHPLDVGLGDRQAVGPDLDDRLRVRHALHGDEDLHGATLLGEGVPIGRRWYGSERGFLHSATWSSQGKGRRRVSVETAS